MGFAVGDAMGFPAGFRRRQRLLQEIYTLGIADFIAIQDTCFSARKFSSSGHLADFPLVWRRLPGRGCQDLAFG